MPLTERGEIVLTFEWYGQACFKVENSSTIVTDPHNGETIGLKPPPADVADVVTISHGHHDHASGEDIVTRGDSAIIKNSGSYTEKGLSIKGIDSFHDKEKGSKRGKNVIFTFRMGGVKVCHLGDLGHLLDGEEIEDIGSVDVLLIPVGGNYTINGSEAADLTELLEPQVVIPMHFLVEGLTVGISGPEEFLEEIGHTYEVKEKSILELKELPEEKQAVKLDCLAN
ncbi:MBL fold metallo-hydrolase [Candidatus Bipolaricaulota bacterium]|nr:MBL fold metallo-hydrolase [Candidatus Bipolaricaulota bacterium]